ncbi:MAG: SpaA isopeptide-forming pilin-related protein [Suipraeoptans sp.]
MLKNGTTTLATATITGNTFARVDLTTFTALSGATITLEVTLSVPGTYSEKTIVNSAKFWLNPTTAGTISVEPGDNADGSTENKITINDPTYTITYKNVGPDGTTAATGTVPEDSNSYKAADTVNVKENEGNGTGGDPLSEDGYRFVGWKSSVASDNTQYQNPEEASPTTQFTMPSEDVEFTPVWLELIDENTFKKTLTGATTDDTYPNPAINDTMEYKVSVKLPSNVDYYKELVIYDTLPTGLEYVSAAISADTGSVTGTVDGSTDKKSVRAVITSFTANQVITITIQVKVVAKLASDITNEAEYWINPANPGDEDNKPTDKDDDPLDPDGETEVKTYLTYNTVYNGNNNTDGTVPVDSNEYAKDDEVTVMGPGDLERDDFVFIGWNSKADGTGTYDFEYDADTGKFTPEEFDMPDEDVTLYAQWRVSKTIDIIKKDGVTKETLEGVEFKLVDKAGVMADMELISNTDGELSFVGLDEGTYELYETKAIAGYQLPYGYWEVEIEIVSDVVVVTFTGITANGSNPPAVEWSASDESYIIYNYESYDLPSTGDMMTPMKLMTMGLFVLILAAGTTLIGKRKRRIKV